MRKTYIQILLLVVATALVVGGGYFVVKSQKYQKESVPDAVDISKVLQSETQQSALLIPGETQQTQRKLPDSLNLKMTFYSQAPFGNWDYPWQEACEEASILLVANTYFDHNWIREDFNDQILKLVEWEKKRFGSYEHTNVDQTAAMIDEYLGLKSVIHEDPTFDDVKKAVAEGHLVVMTFAGKKLGNPFYTNGGPNYHAMVIKGYKLGEKIITADVGTKRGEDYVYSWETVDAALHDYAEPIENGAKRMIEVLPPNAKTAPPSNSKNVPSTHSSLR